MNKRRVLNDKSIASFKPASAGHRTTIYDALVPGLAVRITDRGHKTFILGARYSGSTNFTVRELGEVGAITMSAVRDKAREWLALIRAGRDPREVERAAAGDLAGETGVYLKRDVSTGRRQPSPVWAVHYPYNSSIVLRP